MDNKEICLLNDSFPPQIDGVANAVVNYARVIKESGNNVCVVTPKYPGADDSRFDYPVIRYPSLDLRDNFGYMAGNPFDIPTLVDLSKRPINLIHSHCPVISNMISRTLSQSLDVPFVMTYHTMFDVDIQNCIKSKLIQEGAIKALVDNVSACDELWVVSKGAGENIKKIGYKGDYIVMENGVDMPKHRCTDEEIINATKGYDLPENVPIFLFVGRLMWYKGLKVILDALAALKYQNFDFRMVFIGGGGDEFDVKAYARKLKLRDKVFFTGPIHDRDVLAAWYCRADLFLFPSVFDTNGLVVREAAACSLGSVLVDGSCAAEGVTDGKDGLLIQENAASLAVELAMIMNNRDYMHKIGENASNNLYVSWDTSIKKAMERYEIVMDNHSRGMYKNHFKVSNELFKLSGDFIELLSKAEERSKYLINELELYL